MPTTNSPTIAPTRPCSTSTNPGILQRHPTSRATRTRSGDPEVSGTSLNGVSRLSAGRPPVALPSPSRGPQVSILPAAES